MRLIDKDALIKQAQSDGAYDYVSASEVADAAEIDAVPVVRGEWVEAKSGAMSVWPDGQVMCSVCKQRMPSQWKKMPPYCYGCGAKMK